jgi:ESCRT-I complex subunit VPS28
LRLEIKKLPATDTHYSDESYAGGRGSGAKPDALAVSETTGAIIQALDAVKLGLLEVDQLAPYWAAAVESLNRHAWLPADVKASLTEWKRTVGGLKASDVLSAAQARQLMFDLESTFNNFRATLK